MDSQLFPSPHGAAESDRTTVSLIVDRSVGPRLASRSRDHLFSDASSPGMKVPS